MSIGQRRPMLMFGDRPFSYFYDRGSGESMSLTRP